MKKARTFLTLLCALALAVGLAACGNKVSTSSFKGEQHAVAQAVSNLQSHATALEAKKICGEDFARTNAARLNASAEGCKKAVESQLKEIDSFEVTVESIQINGNRATARVKSVHSGKKRVSTMKLVKEGAKWRVSGVS
jgi:Putative lumazine-binding